MPTITRSELIERIALKFQQERNGLTPQDVDHAVRAMLDTMSDAVASGRRVEVRGFGAFSVTSRPPRVGRNPKTGEPVHVPAKYAPFFRAGKELRECVNAGVENDPINKDKENPS